MKLNFANGTARQQTQYRQALHRLLNFPFEAIPLTVDISFVDGSLLTNGESFDLARTTWTYGSPEATTEVRDDAPGFANADASLEALAASMGLVYNADIHFNETAVHETGHALFAALPEEVRIAVAQMFGAESDDIEELELGDRWEDRIIEGIADTFKEAFLPRRFRVFPNRTNRRIPYSRFPEFRKLFRDAMPETGGGELAPGEKETPGYNLDIFAQGEPTFDNGWPNAIDGKGGKDGLWQYSFANNESGPDLHNAGASQNSEWEGWVKDGTVLHYSFLLPLETFDAAVIGAPYFAPKALLSQYNDCGIQWQVFTRKKLAEPESFFHHAIWSRTIMDQKTFEEGHPPGSNSEWAGGGWILHYEARGGGIPPVLFEGSIEVNSTNFTETLKCGGETYRRVWIYGQIFTNFTVQWPETKEEAERLREATTYLFLPSLEFKQPACTGGGEKGLPVVLPPTSLQPHGVSRGARPTRRPTAGFIHEEGGAGAPPSRCCLCRWPLCGGRLLPLGGRGAFGRRLLALGRRALGGRRLDRRHAFGGRFRRGRGLAGPAHAAVGRVDALRQLGRHVRDALGEAVDRLLADLACLQVGDLVAESGQLGGYCHVGGL